VFHGQPARQELMMRARSGPARRRLRAMTMIEFLVVVVVLGVLVAMVLPSLRRARPKAKSINCANNVRQTGIAFRLFAMDNHDRFPMRLSVSNGGTMEFGTNLVMHFRALSNDLAIPKLLRCPVDSRRTVATNFASLAFGNISYFVSLDADPGRPPMLLSGDDHMMVRGIPVRPGLLSLTSNSFLQWTSARHDARANVCLPDGSVYQSPFQKWLFDLLRGLGPLTNRIVVAP